MFRGSIAPDPLHCTPALILKNVFGSRVSPTFPGKWMQGRERRRGGEGGGGVGAFCVVYDIFWGVLFEQFKF